LEGDPVPEKFEQQELSGLPGRKTGKRGSLILSDEFKAKSFQAYFGF
jgi:hypothetical protein